MNHPWWSIKVYPPKDGRFRILAHDHLNRYNMVEIPIAPGRSGLTQTELLNGMSVLRQMCEEPLTQRAVRTHTVQF